VSRPVVGISAAVERARWAAWDVDVNLLPRTYTRVVTSAGALALILPAQDPDAAVEALEHCDALIVAGGSDVDPAAYGAEPEPRTAGVRPERDAFELALVREALERRMPLLGVCRGMEVLNVACGGSLDQHLETASVHLHTPGKFCDHEVELEPGSLAARVAGAERLEVRSHHHQGVERLGEGLVASGRSVDDRVIEAIELPAHAFALGVLWHTEEEERSRFVAALVAATRSEVATG
jgi:putative glutamine amidotransferase